MKITIKVKKRDLTLKQRVALANALAEVTNAATGGIGRYDITVSGHGKPSNDELNARYPEEEWKEYFID